MRKFLHLASLLATLPMLLAGCTESAEVEDMLTASPLRISSSAAGEEKTIAIQSKCDWTAECDADWITLLATRGDAGKSELKIKVLPNIVAKARTAEIRIVNQQYDVQRKINVTQEKFTPKIETDTKEIRSDCTEKVLTVSVESNITWKAKCSADWVTVSPASGQAGKSTLTVTVMPNLGTEARNTEITIGNQQYDVQLKIAVTQGKSEFIDIPDAGFRKYLLENFDSDGDGLLSKTECEAIDTIDCNGKTYPLPDISSLQGIEHFKALMYLDCYYNKITSLDVSKNTNLQSLNCYGNYITTLDVSKNPNLKELYCYGTQITTLDVSNNPNLKELYCHGTQITTLDVSNNPNLQSLDCGFTQITSLDVSKNPNLQSLDCSFTQITSLDVSKNTNLEWLFCYGTQITTLDVSNNPNLEWLSCYNNTQLKTIYLKTGQNIAILDKDDTAQIVYK